MQLSVSVNGMARGEMVNLPASLNRNPILQGLIDVLRRTSFAGRNLDRC
jgi:hypothetical protein